MGYVREWSGPLRQTRCQRARDLESEAPMLLPEEVEPREEVRKLRPLMPEELAAQPTLLHPSAGCIRREGGRAAWPRGCGGPEQWAEAA